MSLLFLLIGLIVTTKIPDIDQSYQKIWYTGEKRIIRLPRCPVEFSESKMCLFSWFFRIGFKLNYKQNFIIHLINVWCCQEDEDVQPINVYCLFYFKW